MAFPSIGVSLEVWFFGSRLIFFGLKAGLLRNFWQERSRGSRFGAKLRNLAVIKTGKGGLWPFPKQVRVGTYPSHPGALPGVALSGSLRTGLIAPSGVGEIRFGNWFLRGQAT